MPKTKATKKPRPYKRVKTSLGMSPHLLDMLRRLADESRYDMSGILEDALTSYLAREREFGVSKRFAEEARREFVAAERVRIIQNEQRIQALIAEAFPHTREQLGAR